MKNKQTWLAWIAPIWFLANSLTLWLASSFVFDWWCGMPTGICRSGELHPLIAAYLRFSLIGMGVLTAAASVFAVRGGLTKPGLVGLCLSLGLALFLLIVSLGA